MIDFIFAAAGAHECAHVAVPKATEQVMSYYYSGNVLWLFQTAWSFIIPLLFLMKGFTGKLGTFSEKKGETWYYGIAIYLTLFLLIYTLLSLPLEFYSGYLRQHEYGLSTQTFGRWIQVYWMEFLICLAFALAFVWIFYYFLKKSPRRWWIYGALVSIGVTFFMTFIQPIWIDPIFNDFEPLHNKHLEKKVVALAERAGMDHTSKIYQVDKSKDTNTLNAYVVGFGSTKQIVLWDNLINKLSYKEVLFVTGHELGHYILKHRWWYLGYFSIYSFALFYFLFRASKYLMKRYHDRFGFKYLHHIASFPLFLLLLNAFVFVTLPITNAVSRSMERQADRFGLELTNDNKSAAKAFVALQKDNLVNPRPGMLYMFWRGTHPSLGERIDTCNSYCPWKEGYQPTYQRYFENESEKK